MKKKILVLGRNGMLGHMVYRRLAQEKDFSVFGTHLDDRDDLFYFDVFDGVKKLQSICKIQKKIDYFINCVGITASRINPSSADSIIPAIKINALFPHQLALLAQEHGIRVIQVSTDGVFSGRTKFYDEDSDCDGSDIYAKTKSLGEVTAENSLTIRCSIVGVSPIKKEGLWEWFQSQADGTTIAGYTNHIWNGVTTLQFAEMCLSLIRNNNFDELRRLSSVFHFAPNPPVSKYKLLTIFKKQLKKNLTIKQVKHPQGVRRVLVSKYAFFKNLFCKKVGMEKAIKQMLELNS